MKKPVYFEDFLDGTDASTRKYKAHVTGEAIQWEHLQVTSTIAPEQKRLALVWIKRCLGYIPAEFVYLPHLSFIQGLLQNKQNGLISETPFVDDIVKHIQNIRNDDMKKDGWLHGRVYKYDMRKAYKLFLPEFQIQARNRLSSLLGYEPLLKYSLGAELHLRTLFEQTSYYDGFPHCEHDFKAAEIVNYRTAYYSFDEITADQCELFAIDRNPFFSESNEYVLP